MPLPLTFPMLTFPPLAPIELVVPRDSRLPREEKTSLRPEAANGSVLLPEIGDLEDPFVAVDFGGAGKSLNTSATKPALPPAVVPWLDLPLVSGGICETLNP